MSDARVQRLLERAQRALSAGFYNLQGGFLGVAANRAYYAAFYVASAALSTVDEQPKTHAGVQHRFHARFVRTGVVPADLGRTLSRTATLRQEADYDEGALLEAADVERALEDAEDFIAFVQDHVLPPDA